MSLLTFVSQEDLDDLDENPRIAFMTLVNKAQYSLWRQLSSIGDTEKESYEREELKHSFMNVIIAAAKQFEIEPFETMRVPNFQDYRVNTDHLQFQSDLDHYMTQIILDNSIRGKRDSVAILPTSKNQIRTYLSGLRQCIEKANMTDAKREALLKRLDDFEIELEKKRLNILAVARLTFELLAVPGAVWASADVTNKLIHNFMQTVAEAKAVEQETQHLPPAVPPKALSPPRGVQKGIISQHPHSRENGRMQESIDDDIPF